MPVYSLPPGYHAGLAGYPPGAGGGTPMLGSMLGLHGKPGGPHPGMGVAGASPPGAAGPFFMAPPFAGALAGAGGRVGARATA